MNTQDMLQGAYGALTIGILACLVVGIITWFIRMPLFLLGAIAVGTWIYFLR